MIEQSARPAPGARLFWAQYGVGLVAGVVIVTLLVGNDVGPVSLSAAALVLAAATAALRVLERRRPVGATIDADRWAQHVRELRASRLEIVTAFEIERRRIERDLHDGTQQHLVTASLKLGEAAYLLGTAPDPRLLAPLLAEAQDATEASLSALRATVSGIHPTILSDLGLRPAVDELAARAPVDVTVRCPHPLPAIPGPVAAAAYFLVSEALTNIAKHAPGARATVLLAADQVLHVSIVDTGPGGAHLSAGRGLSGMAERLDAFGGSLTVHSPVGGPTTVTARLPLLLEPHPPAAAAPAQEGR